MIQFGVSPEEAAKAAQGGGGGVLPIGVYVLRVESKEWKAPKSADKFAQLVCKCQVLKSFNNQNLGKTITRRFNMNPKSIPYGIARFLQAAGIPYQMQNGTISFDDDHVLGGTTEVDCSHEPGESRTFEQWDNDRPVSGQTQHVTPAAPQQMPQGNYAPPQGGWAPPPAQQMQPAQPPQQFGPPQGWVPPQQGYQQPQQPQYAPPQQSQPQNGGAPPWLQQPAQPGYPQQPHIAGQGPIPPRGQG
jgi:hypothetical protein